MSASNNAPMLEVHDLTKRFGSFYAVKNLSFKVNRGEVFGFLGPNGAGKTTTMRMLTCYLPPTSGTMKIAGVDTLEHSLEIRKKIGYLPESSPLYNDMKVREYLKFVGLLRGIKGAELTNAIDSMLNICGLDTMINRQIGKLSKGYRQRVGLAQAMIHSPDLLVLDEPMSGLDPNQIVEIRQLIKAIGQEKTVLYCSHILSEIKATCNRILIINDGISVATGTPDELTSGVGRGDYYTLSIKGDRDKIAATLGSIDDVVDVSLKDSSEEWHNVIIKTNNTVNIGELLFHTIVDNGWTLSELRREETSLEEAFTQLTIG